MTRAAARYLQANGAPESGGAAPGSRGGAQAEGAAGTDRSAPQSQGGARSGKPNRGESVEREASEGDNGRRGDGGRRGNGNGTAPPSGGISQ